jgi:DNA invertase Pin-like site-specific DNA recombinase
VPRKKSDTDRTLIGYARVSTAEQNLDMQVDALRRAGVHPDAIHVEKVSGVAANRPVLEWALDELRPGDTFMVWRLDRMGRSLRDLMDKMDRIKAAGAQFRSLTEHFDTTTAMGKLYFGFSGMVAEFERDMIVERTRAGVRLAAQRGVKFGPKRKLNATQIKQAQKLRDSGLSLRDVAKRMGVSHTTIEEYTIGASRRTRKK